MYVILIVVAVLFVLLMVFNNLKPIISKKTIINKLKNYLESSNLNYQIFHNKNDKFDIKLEINNIIYFVKIIVIPNFSEIQINNKATWEVKYGAGNTLGKAQPNKRYLTEIIDFQNMSVNDEKKVVIFTPKPKKVVKYINECEIILVNSKTDVYGTTIISDTQLGYFIKNQL